MVHDAKLISKCQNVTGLTACVPAAPPKAFPRVELMISTRPLQFKYSSVPLHLKRNNIDHYTIPLHMKMITAVEFYPYSLLLCDWIRD